MQFSQMQQWTVTWRSDQRVEEKLVARRQVEDALATQLLEAAERKVKQLAEENFNRAADEEKRTKRQREADEKDARKRRKKQQKQKNKQQKKKREIEQRQQEVKEREDEEDYWCEKSWAVVEDAAMEKAEAWHQRRSAERAVRAVRAAAESVRREERQTRVKRNLCQKYMRKYIENQHLPIDFEYFLIKIYQKYISEIFHEIFQSACFLPSC